MKSPTGYTLDNLGHFEFFMRRHGDDLLEELEKSEAVQMSERMTLEYSALMQVGMAKKISDLESENQKLKSQLGTLKARV
jgi:hypothetical protein